METLERGINRKIRDFSIGFVTFNFLTKKFGENFLLIFVSTEKRRESLFTYFERKEKRETKIIKKVFLIILSI